jgi:hypothetical protein
LEEEASATGTGAAAFAASFFLRAATEASSPLPLPPSANAAAATSAALAPPLPPETAASKASGGAKATVRMNLSWQAATRKRPQGDRERDWTRGPSEGRAEAAAVAAVAVAAVVVIAPSVPLPPPPPIRIESRKVFDATCSTEITPRAWPMKTTPPARDSSATAAAVVAVVVEAEAEAEEERGAGTAAEVPFSPAVASAPASFSRGTVGSASTATLQEKEAEMGALATEKVSSSGGPVANAATT